MFFFKITLAAYLIFCEILGIILEDSEDYISR